MIGPYVLVLWSRFAFVVFPEGVFAQMCDHPSVGTCHGMSGSVMWCECDISSRMGGHTMACPYTSGGISHAIDPYRLRRPLRGRVTNRGGDQQEQWFIGVVTD